VHCSKYTQSSSPIIIPKSINLQFVFLHSLHLKSCPEKSFFATPLPILGFVIFSFVMINSFVLHGSQVWQVWHIRY